MTDTQEPSLELVARLLDLELPENDAQAATVREYLQALLGIVWQAGDGISPWGNSGWHNDLYVPMMRAGMITGRLDDEHDHYVLDMDAEAGNRLILAAIRSFGRPPTPAPAALPDGGRWLQIAFKGFTELTGYVTEVIVAGQPVFHVDLPERIWGGDEMAWREYAASSLHGRWPVTEASVKAAWEARVRSHAERMRWLADEEARLELDASPADQNDYEGNPF
jgi:hypothetical protein